MGDEEVSDYNSDDSDTDEEADESSDLDGDVFDNWSQDVSRSDTDIGTAEQETISSTIAKCRRLIKTISKSSVLTNFVDRLKIDMKLSRSLALHCPTRWNSTHRLVKSMLINKSLLTRLFVEHKHSLTLTTKQHQKMSELELSRDDWTTLENIELVLRPFYQASKLISGQSYATIGMSYFAITGIRDFLMDQSSASNVQLNECKRLLLEQINRYFEHDYDQIQWIKVSLLELYSEKLVIL